MYNVNAGKGVTCTALYSVCILLYEAHGIVCVFCSELDDVQCQCWEGSYMYCIVQCVHLAL